LKNNIGKGVVEKVALEEERRDEGARNLPGNLILR